MTPQERSEQLDRLTEDDPAARDAYERSLGDWLFVCGQSVSSEQFPQTAYEQAAE